MKRFVHLHVHTEYSLLDGAARIDNLIDKCSRNNMPAIAITDHGNMYGVIDFYDKIAKHNSIIKEYKERRAKGEIELDSNLENVIPLKLIIGCEFYVVDDIQDHNMKMSSFNHLVLLAKNEQGYKNLLKLNSIAFTEGFYYKPRVDIKLLEQYADGLICLSACLAGGVARALVADDYEAALSYARKMQGIYDKDDFYIEIQDHGIIEQKKTNPLLIKIAKEIGADIIATNDVHYIDKEDSVMHDILLCVQTGRLESDTNRMRFSGSEFYLKTGDEMSELFEYIPEAIENSIKIAEKCNHEIKFNNPLYPKFSTPDGTSTYDFLCNLIDKGIEKRYKGAITKEIRDRADFELGVVDKMGFVDYYLVVWDFINYSASNGIPVGPGRGSGAGSIIAYAIGITDVDPIKYGLFFERFLNPDRISPPDFDIDFCYEGRGKVIQYVIDKYGIENVVQIITFGTMATKGAIKDVARAKDIPLQRVNNLTKLIPTMNKGLKAILGLEDNKKNIIPEVIEIYNADPELKAVIDMAVKLEGMPRNTSTHAAGVVICCDTVSNHVPLQKNGNDVTTQYNMKQIEALGLLKMDFLGLRTLTDIDYAVRYVKETTGIDLNFDELGLEDEAVFKTISSGNTGAVFQLESEGMKNFMRNLNPQCFEDIIAGISLFRPGPMSYIDTFIEGKKNPKGIVYPDPMLEQVLDVTYGVITYQEQVMKIAQIMGGFSLSSADILRKAMGKKQKDLMEKMKIKFLQGAKDKGVNKAVAKKVFGDMEKFAEYAFNKSHATAYAVISYRTAFLKCYYPVELYAAVVNNRITKADERKKYLEQAIDLGISILPPCINRSGSKCSCEEGSIRYGLMSIRNVGEQASEEIRDERMANGEYKDLYDFIDRINQLHINKRTIEALILTGALDCLGENRATMIRTYENMMKIVADEHKNASSGQLSLFGLIEDDNVSSPEIFRVAEYPERKKLSYEEEFSGLYFSGHPLDGYRNGYENESILTTKIIKSYLQDDIDLIESLADLNNQEVVMAGLLRKVEVKLDKQNRRYCTCSLQDLSDTIDVVAFSGVFERFKDFFVEQNIVQLTGRFVVKDDGYSVMLKTISEWIPSKSNNSIKPQKTLKAAAKEERVKSNKVLWLRLEDKEQSESVIDILQSYKGICPVKYAIKGSAYEAKISVSIVKALILELNDILGKENVFVKEI